MLTSILGFLVILAPLVIVHEFGHFLFAKLFNVKAEAFSVGFGPRLWKKQIGETEFRVSAIPLGGYVKLFGEDPSVELSEEEKKRALQHAKPFHRFLIFFGGPLFNFLFAILVFMAILAIGEPKIKNTIGRVIDHSYAEQVGFKSGDQILEIQGVPVLRFEEIVDQIRLYPNRSVDFKVKRIGQDEPLVIPVRLKTTEGYSKFGEIKDVGDLPGLQPIPRSTRVGISNPKSLAAQAGLKTGDQLVSLNGNVLNTWEDFERDFALLPVNRGATLVVKDASGAQKTVELSKMNSQLPQVQWGMYSVELFIDRTMPESPAAEAGIQPGDRMISVDGQAIVSFFDLRERIQKSAKDNNLIALSWERDGQTMNAEIVPTETKGRDPSLNKVSDFTIGVAPMDFVGAPVTEIERIFNPFVLVYKASERVIDFTWRNLVSIGKMITGNVSVATLGGPILIGKIAGDSIERGLISFLTTMAILSVGLGILNILPIPVLDGGHILLLAIEVIRKRPLSVRQIEVLQQVGLSLILILMVVVIKNDLTRLPIFN